MDNLKPAVEIRTDWGVHRVHSLKTWPEHYEAVVSPDLSMRKVVELRRLDRDFRVGDFLWLREYDAQKGSYTGRSCQRKVTHLLIGGPWLSAGYAALSLSDDVLQVANLIDEQKQEEGQHE
ncbi:hypothetical protein C162_26035 [Paenibacillus sp. FSL R7-269]|uniref:DUF3850 domain-containing protein n=1 Tax=Paenibacillus sp. FSL R7-269 TaxID=1226755 RepID=UPI0003E28634|nr:DUF3850 domain-containing protein [Paenibacillus sp. FSL R7-269]ETT41598.1 hypothetical protein C162_26035 [Paenibacillus sp. FSL R7-269]